MRRVASRRVTLRRRINALAHRESRLRLISPRCPRMGWSGRAPALPASQAGKGGTEDKGAFHVRETQQQNRRDRHRYRQEFVPHRRPRSAWSPGAAPEVVAWPSGSAACQPAAVSDWHGGLHRVRERLVSQRTGIINQIRAFLLERGIAVRQGLRFLRAELPDILAKRTDVLSPRILRIVEDLSGDWRRLDERIEGLSSEIEALARQDQGCARLMSVPGIGPIISSAMVAAIGTGDPLSKGRDFGAWLGLVPKQMSTGDRTILGNISRRGNRYLRTLFVQAAWVVLVKVGPKQWERYGLKSWIEAAKKRLHHNVLAIALANKLARIAWAVLNKGRAFECVKTEETASQPA